MVHELPSQREFPVDHTILRQNWLITATKIASESGRGKRGPVIGRASLPASRV